MGQGHFAVILRKCPFPPDLTPNGTDIPLMGGSPAQT